MSLTSCEWEKLCCSGLTASSVEGVRLESFKAADSWIVIWLTAQNTSRTFQLFREKNNCPETPLRNVRGSFYCGQGKSSTCRYPTGFQEILSLYLLPIHIFDTQVGLAIAQQQGLFWKNTFFTALLSAFESPHHHQRILAARQEAGNSMIRFGRHGASQDN